MTTRIAIIGAAETEHLGRLPDISELELHAAAARLALTDAGLMMSDIDGIACAIPVPTTLADYLGVEPRWYDGTDVGGCSYLNLVRHAAAAIACGYCSTVLVVHGESGYSRVGSRRYSSEPVLLEFEFPYGVSTAVNRLTLPALRYMKETGLTETQLASVTVAQSRWAEHNPRAGRNTLITVQDVLNSPIVAYPFHMLECCLVTDGGGALVLTSAERVRVLGTRRPPVWIIGTGEAAGQPLSSQIPDAGTFEAFGRSSHDAFLEAGLGPKNIDHLMIYDAFAHIPLYGLADMGFVARGEAGAFIEDGNTSPGGALPMNTNGGGICYTHTGRYGMFAILESVRQLRHEAYRNVPNIEVSMVQGLGGMFAAASTLILSDRLP